VSLLRRTAGLLLVALGACGAAATDAGADTTIGADINHSFNFTGSCNGGGNPLQRPCAVVILSIPDRAVRSPCDGTVTRYRMNGFASANSYRLRVVHDNQNGSYTPTATSDAVSKSTNGVSEFATNLPIGQDDLVALDFMDSDQAAINGYFENNPGVQEAYFYTWPDDGTPDSPTGVETSYYLFNADVACDPAATPTSPGSQATPGASGTPAKKCKKKKKHRAAAAKKKGCKKKKRK
jgi:hypothetical protein